MSQRAPIVAIVGRANVGKSSLFNAILGYREAIVAMEPGTTRDNVTAKASFKQHDFWLVDTAGMKDPADDFELGIQEQIIQATDSADVILVLVEAGIMITDEDRRVAKLALKSKKPLILVVNKADRSPNSDTTYYMRLGIKPIVATSMTQRTGVADLLTEVVKELPITTIHQDENRIRLAILGRPNVGKSNLFNALAQKQQALVSSKAGTTRDINRTIIKFENQEMELLDTAGIRRNGKIEVGIEKFSVLRSLGAIEQADVCLLLVDANETSVQLDQKIAGLVKEAGKGLILVVSKWDIVDDKTPYTRDNIAGRLRIDYEFIPWAPLIFTSAVTGQNVTKIFSLVTEIVKNRGQRISTPILNRWLRACADSHPPAGMKNTNPKLNYITQTDDATPTFKVFGSHTKMLHWSYRRYLDKQLRQSFGFEGTPVKFYFLEKHINKHKSL